MTHFHEEEPIVFPLAEQLSNSKTLVDLSQSWKAQRRRTRAEPKKEGCTAFPHHPAASAAFTAVTSAATRVASGKSDGASSV